MLKREDSTHRFLVPSEILTRGRWIWPKSLFHDLYNGYALFRKRVTLPHQPDVAWAVVTADQSYRLYINGHFICRGPARGYQKSWPADTVDLAPYLQEGENLIAVRAYNPGCSSFQYVSEDCAGFFFAAKIGEIQILSDGSWRCRRQAGVSRDTEPSSLQLFPQEHFDTRIESANWLKLDFDDAAWESPALSTAWNSLPWSSIEPREIPMLREEQIPITCAIARQKGRSEHPWRRVRDVLALRQSEGFNLKPIEAPVDAEPWLEVETVAPGCFTSYLFDLEKTQFGNLAVQAQGTCGGEAIDFAYSETVDPHTLEPHCADPEVRLGSRMICDREGCSHVFFHPYGYRYLIVTVRGNRNPIRIKLQLHGTRYPLVIEGRFRSSDSNLQQIWNSCAWTQQICALDAYVDTPWREQAQWWGDARVQAWNTFHLCSDARLLRRGIRIMSGQMTNTGLTYGHAPTKAHSCVVPDFSLIWLITLWDYYWQTGDATLIQEFEQSIRQVLGYFETQTDSEHGLVAHDPRYWLFLDWADLFREGYSTLLTLWLIIALEKLEGLAKACGCETQWKHLAPWRAELIHGVRSLIGEDNLIRDGRTWDGVPVESSSIHTQTLAIDAGIANELTSAMAEKCLLPFIRGKVQRKKWPSIYWMAYVFRALTRLGHGAEVIRFIRGPWQLISEEGVAKECPSGWEQMASHGTTWSQFGTYGGRQSHSHAWSAHPLFHLMENLGGIRQSAPSWTRIRYQPVFLGDWAEVTIPTPLGIIRSSWRRESMGQVIATLTLPAGIRAETHLGGSGCHEVTGSNQWIVLPVPGDSRPPTGSLADLLEQKEYKLRVYSTG